MLVVLIHSICFHKRSKSRIPMILNCTIIKILNSIIVCIRQPYFLKNNNKKHPALVDWVFRARGCNYCHNNCFCCFHLFHSLIGSSFLIFSLSPSVYVKLYHPWYISLFSDSIKLYLCFYQIPSLFLSNSIIPETLLSLFHYLSVLIKLYHPWNIALSLSFFLCLSLLTFIHVLLSLTHSSPVFLFLSLSDCFRLRER